MILLALAGCLFVSDTELDRFLDEDQDGHDAVALGGDDCDDEDSGIVTSTWHVDADGDGFGDPGATAEGCEAGAGLVDNADDCDDTDATVTLASTWYRDEDTDTYGDPTVTATSCAAPDGFVPNDDDCDDTDPRHGLPLTNYLDADADGYGDPDETLLSCVWEDGYTTNDFDCDDADPAVHPDAIEYGATDHDCDGATGDGRLDNAGVFFIGDYTGARIGTAAVPVGDIDGDGFGDIAVGLPGAGAEQVRIGSGAASVGEPGDIQAIRLEGARTWWDEGQAEAGTALAVGDFDGDGVSDLAAAAPGGGALGSGTVALFWGRFPAAAVSPDASLLGTTASDRFGETVAAGESTGDGVGDLAISAPLARTVYLVAGPVGPGENVGVDVALATFRVGTDASADRTLPLALGDMDLDGRDDVLIGTPWLDTGRVDTGGVYFCIGGAPGVYDAAEHCNGQVTGEVAGDSLGASVAVGDLDRDGWLDLVVGAPGVDGAVADMGAVYIFLGREDLFWNPLEATDADVTLHGEAGADSTGGRAGSSVAVVGDIDGSGGLDLAIGAPAWNDVYEGYGVGAAWFVLGPFARGATSLGEAEERFTCMYGTGSSDGGCAAGTFVAPAGDIDGDGLADTLVGAPGWIFDEDATGAVALVFGKNVR